MSWANPEKGDRFRAPDGRVAVVTRTWTNLAGLVSSLDLKYEGECDQEPEPVSVREFWRVWKDVK